MVLGYQRLTETISANIDGLSPAVVNTREISLHLRNTQIIADVLRLLT